MDNNISFILCNIRTNNDVEVGTMLNEEIDKAIKKSGLKKVWIAEQLDITYNSLRRKLNGEIQWNKLELEKLNKLLQNYL